MKKTLLAQRAVVVGGGMGGLFAARVLSDHFDEVVILDRDHEPTTDARGAVPQGNHFHVLLPGGLDAMCEWFPGFADDLAEAGGIEMRLGVDFYVYTSVGKSYSLQAHVPEPFEVGALTYVQTRPQLEHCVRRRVATLPNVSFRHRTLVDGPIVENGRVTGVTIRDGEPLSADLVIDASGRNSLTTQWLPDLGYDTAPETYVNCDVTYASVLCEPSDWDAFDGSVFFVMPSADEPARFGAVVKLPDGKWLINLGGRYGDVAPTDWDGFCDFGRSLVHPAVGEMIDTVEPLTDVKTYRMKRAVRHHYEQVDRFPEGLVPVADSVCFFNPTHGQGMSSAAGQIRGLQSVLADRAQSGRGLDGVALEFFPVAAEWVRGPWILAAMTDFQNPNCTGDFPDEDLPDLMLLGELAADVTAPPEAIQLLNDIATLRRPLSDIRSLATT